MSDKNVNNIFQSLFKMTYEPFYVNNKIDAKDEKNHFPTIFSAVAGSNYNSIIKITQGLYVQKLQIISANIKIQASQPTTNAIIANTQFPSLTVELPNSQDKLSLQSLKFAHICQPNYNLIKTPSLKHLKQNHYRCYKTGVNINTNILIRKGTVYMDQCKISLAAQKDPKKLIPCIVLQKKATLIMNRCQIRGGVGTIGIVNKGGKIIIKQTNFKNGAIGILCVGNKSTNVIVKNCNFNNCLQSIVLAGPFQGIIQSNVIQQSQVNGFNILSGNRCKIVNNQISKCQTGIRIQNCCPTLMKNTIIKNKFFGIQCHSTRNIQCWPLIKFNFIHQNQNGGIYVQGNRNKAQLFNNELHYNNKVGIRVQKGSSPHILLNQIKNTLGNGLQILQNSTSFIEKNYISGSLQCNVVIQGPNNIGNYMYNNTLQGARGQGLFILNSQRFLINNNRIYQNQNNGILSITSVCCFQQNIIEQNKNNGVLLIDDNQIVFTQNQIIQNRKAGIVLRNTSKGLIKKNCFVQNTIEILVQNNHPSIQNIAEDNYFAIKDHRIDQQNRNKQQPKQKNLFQTAEMPGNSGTHQKYLNIDLNNAKYDIRVPKNYYFCQII